MRSEITFSQLKKFFEHVLGIKLKRDLHADWMRVLTGKRKFVWHCHATLLDARGNAINELEVNGNSLPKKLTQAELKEFYIEQWKEGEISYQYLYFSGHEVEEAMQQKSILMQYMNQRSFDRHIEDLRIKDNCKKLKEYDGLSESELKMKLIIMGIL